MSEVLLCHSQSIAEGAVQIYRVNEVEIALIREKNELYAYKNQCPHQGGPACEGVRRARVVDKIDEEGNYLGQEFDEREMLIVCPWHGYSFSLKTGANICDPKVKLHRYQVLEKDENVYVVV